MNLELSPNRADVFLVSLERKSGRPRRNIKRANFRQRIDDFLADAVREELVVGIGTHVRERQHCDRHSARVCDLGRNRAAENRSEFGNGEIPVRRVE